MKHPDRVIIHDETDRELRKFWQLGDLIDGTPYHYGCTSPAHVYRTLESHVDRHEIPVFELQFWGHAKPGAMLVGGAPLNFNSVYNALGHPVEGYTWLRGCEFALKYARMEAAVLQLGGAVVAHTKVISAEPKWAPWIQGGICSLRPGETPWWNDKDRITRGPFANRRLGGCWVTTMNPPNKCTYDRTPVV